MSNIKTILIDDEDYDKDCEYIVTNHKGYLKANVKVSIGIGGAYKLLSLASYIMEPGEGFVVDHINRDTLDNRRKNLRVCTYSQNSCNSITPSNNTSGIKGVSKRRNKWVVYIGINNKTMYGGAFKCPLIAANKYRELAVKHHKEFARFSYIE